jgi:ATP-dependent Clp endopeptidase proteolytic subunit ClpP
MASKDLLVSRGGEVPEPEPESDNHTDDKAVDTSQIVSLGDVFGDLMGEKPSIRKLGIIGDIAEEKTSDIIYGMLLLHDSREQERLKDPTDPKSEIEKVVEPFEVIISTNGGDAREMFAIYDMMRHIRKDCEIATLGIGKVMSAGVPLLAAGTKGKRRIGKYCRIMLHNVSAGTIGAIPQMQNEMKEVEKIQKQYIEILATETNMTERQIKKLINKNVNVYLSAEEALELGIVDEII